MAAAPVLIFGKDTCPYTQAARDDYARRHVEVQYFDVKKNAADLTRMLEYLEGPPARPGDRGWWHRHDRFRRRHVRRLAAFAERGPQKTGGEEHDRQRGNPSRARMSSGTGTGRALR